ncbi:seipin-2 [Rhodamnia argentea]|uniref:Seipin-2 n=1 Tax=Rhodamnia argentea TaxID=178133 RepID=A0A8B8QJR4_9MYRT|nr:seipin-2 [Rhodamnia argentea]
MGSPNSSDEDDGSIFHDAYDDFPFYDSLPPDDSAVSLDESESKPAPKIPSGLRRRQASRVSAGGATEAVSGFAARSREERSRLYCDLKEDEGPIERARSDVDGRGSISVPDVALRGEGEESTITTWNYAGVGDSVGSIVTPFEVCNGASQQKNDVSTVSSVDDDRIGDSVDSADSVVALGQATSSSLLISVAGLLIQAIGFQINLLVSFLTFPFWCFRTFYAFVFNPYATIRRGLECITGKSWSIWNLIFDHMSPYVHEWFKENKSFWKLVLRCGWGLFWSIYVCFILFGLLVSATLISGLVMRFLVAEPIRIEEKLNFDYTKHSPAAYVPISSCAGVDCGIKCREIVNVGKRGRSRVIPPHHKLEATVSLTLPESEYNRNLGVFQVRIDLLSADGEVLSSLSHPRMLLFKSEPIRLLLTFLKVVPLVAGYVSESETIYVKFQGFIEGDVPTACIKVILEQRAEFHPGAGIPEIYYASLTLESELPLLRRILWYWKRTIFIWVSMVMFTVELLFTLICCKPILIPRMRWSVDSARSDDRNALPS